MIKIYYKVKRYYDENVSVNQGWKFHICDWLLAHVFRELHDRDVTINILTAINKSMAAALAKSNLELNHE